MLISVATKIYDVIITLLLPLLFFRLFIKSFKVKAYRWRWLERLGIFVATQPNGIWIHAVSVGEVMAAVPTIQQIKNQFPAIPITITCSTPAGSAIIKKQFATTVFHVYFPFDASFAIKNLLIRIKPKLLIILEKEIWPNLIYICAKQHIPIIIANAQISNKSFRRYLIIKPLIASWLKTVKFICTQTKFDAYKFKKLLGSSSLCNVMVVGNTKFDLAIQNSQTNKDLDNNKNIALRSNRPTWIAASTHNGEEEIILQAHKKILEKIPNALLILCPRHIERCIGLKAQINLAEISYVLRSSQKSIDLNTITAQIFLVDSMGELNFLYSLSQVAFVGGSLVPKIGGHNILEPAAMALPIVVGPYNANFKQIVFKMKLAQGVVTVKNKNELAEIISQWLINKSLREEIGGNAKNFLCSQTGASEIIAKLAIKVVGDIKER